MQELPASATGFHKPGVCRRNHTLGQRMGRNREFAGFTAKGNQNVKAGT